MTTVIDPVAHYMTFAREASPTTGSQPAWLARVREQAIEAFRTRGFPTTSDEEWRFTNVAPIVEQTFVPASRDPARLEPGMLDESFLPGVAARVVFVNGRYAPELSAASAVPGVRVERLSDAKTIGAAESYLGRVARFDRQAFVALNTALWTDGVLITVGKGTILDAPIQLIFVSAPERAVVDGESGDGTAMMSNPRVLVVAGANSQASIVETYLGVGQGRYFTNSVTEAVISENATLEHYKVQRENEESYHVATIHAKLARSGRFNEHSIGFGGALVRNDLLVTLGGEGGESVLNGLYLADAKRLVDNHTTIDHAMPHCDSREVYKGILAGQARAVFNGKIIVRPDAQKTDAKQTNKALLLSPDAQINTKPQLEIFANDVKCTHGAAVGQMDDDALFYLRARGIPLAEARALLVQAFAGDVLNRVALQPVRDQAERELLRQLSKWGGLS